MFIPSIHYIHPAWDGMGWDETYHALQYDGCRFYIYSIYIFSVCLVLFSENLSNLSTQTRRKMSWESMLAKRTCRDRKRKNKKRKPCPDACTLLKLMMYVCMYVYLWQITYETLAYFSSAGTGSFLSRIYLSIYSLPTTPSDSLSLSLSSMCSRLTFFETSIQGTVNRMNHSLACLPACLHSSK